MRELSWICKFHEICHHKSVTLNELFTSFEFQWNRPRSTKMQKKLIYWQFLLRHCSIPTLRWIWHCTGYSQKLKKYLNSIFHILNLHKQMLAFIQMKNETRENWLRKPPGGKFGLLVKVIKFSSSFTRRDVHKIFSRFDLSCIQIVIYGTTVCFPLVNLDTCHCISTYRPHVTNTDFESLWPF